MQKKNSGRKSLTKRELKYKNEMLHLIKVDNPINYKKLRERKKRERQDRMLGRRLRKVKGRK